MQGDTAQHEVTRDTSQQISRDVTQLSRDVTREGGVQHVLKQKSVQINNRRLSNSTYQGSTTSEDTHLQSQVGSCAVNCKVTTQIIRLVNFQ